MKRFVLFLSPLCAVFLLTSCYMMSTRPTGTIKLAFGGPMSRAISATSTVRVYLYTFSSSNNYSLYTFPTGTQYQDFQYASGTATLSDIPVGLWEVLVAIGNSVNGSFQSTVFGESSVIDVFGGVDTSATVATQASFTYSSPLNGLNLSDAFYDYNGGATSSAGRVLFVANSSALYSISPANQTVPIDLSTDLPTPITLPAGLQINSLSEGLSAVVLVPGTIPIYSRTYSMLINSNLGIVPYAAGVFDTSNFSYSLGAAPGSPYTILQSVAVTSNLTSYGTAVYYARSQGLGGTYFDTSTLTPYSTVNTSGSSWVDINLAKQVSQNAVYQISTDVSSAGKGFAYFATKLGAFRADPTLIQSGSANTGNLSTAVPISAANSAAIQAIAVDDFDGVLYIGTSSGAFYATLAEASTTSAIAGNWVPVPETNGENIVSIKVDQSDGQLSVPEAVAFRSTSNNIYTFSAPPGQGGVEKIYPYFSGLPGTVNSMEFGLGILFLAGTQGLASVSVGTLPPL